MVLWGAVLQCQPTPPKFILRFLFFFSSSVSASSSLPLSQSLLLFLCLSLSFSFSVLPPDILPEWNTEMEHWDGILFFLIPSCGMWYILEECWILLWCTACVCLRVRRDGTVNSQPSLPQRILQWPTAKVPSLISHLQFKQPLSQIILRWF